MKVMRSCLREPVPEIEKAAALLQQAVDAHFADQPALVIQLLDQSNMPAIRAWTESLWGKNSPYSPSGTYHSTAEPAELPGLTRRMPDLETQRALIKRDGFYCRFCGIPLVRKQVRERLSKLYPQARIWGRKNQEQHAALQCMWLQFDHLLPHARGGSNDLDNLVVTCAPCNFGRMEYTLEETGLLNPLERAPRRGDWSGLESILGASTLSVTEVVLEVSSEGGGYVIEGQRTESGWRFRCRLQSMWDEGEEPKPPWHRSLERALSEMNSGWRRLEPVHVHPDFAAHIWTAVQSAPPKRKETLAAWQALCQRS